MLHNSGISLQYAACTHDGGLETIRRILWKANVLITTHVPAGPADKGEHCANGRIIIQPIYDCESLSHEENLQCIHSIVSHVVAIHGEIET